MHVPQAWLISATSIAPTGSPALGTMEFPQTLRPRSRMLLPKGHTPLPCVVCPHAPSLCQAPVVEEDEVTSARFS